MAEKGTKGTEALESAPKKASKPAAESKPKASKKATKGREVHRVISTKLKDGTVHHEHHYRKPDGSPDFQTDEFSSATPQDAGDHVAEAMGGGAPGAGDADEGAPDAAAAAGGAPDAAAAGGAPVA